MRCIRCRTDLPAPVERCPVCDFPFGSVPEGELGAWFGEVRSVLETAYLAAETPWGASGKGGTYADWVRLRIPIAECVTGPGRFLDVGCANGYLLECLIGWCAAKGITIEPHGLDYAEGMVAAARRRLPEAAIHHGNILDWQPPQRYDYVRTEVVYVPDNYRTSLIDRLLREFVAPGGSLLIAYYSARNEPMDTAFPDLQNWTVSHTVSGYDGQGRERCRVAVIQT